MPQITVESSNHIAEVTLTNPPRGYLNNENATELLTALEKLAATPEIRVIILTGGVPGVFIRHYDVGEIVAMAKVARRAQQTQAGETPAAVAAVHQAISLIDGMAKPVIAAINGYAQGGGFETALACDIRIAEAGDYRIGLPETNIGIFPGAGGTQRLPRVIGMARALEMILRGRTVDPEEAARIGLVHELTRRGGALARAREIAAEIADRPPLAVGMAKQLVKSALDRPVAEGVLEEREMFDRILREDDTAIDAMRWFLDNGEDINSRPPGGA